ncbi:MAG: hypothetical protein V3R85_03250 [Alphaproteobacteria bacterium]
MRIERRDSLDDHAQKLASDIAEAAFANGIEGRVCSESCTVKCPQCGSTACQCECSPDCPDASSMLSAEPDQYPVEPGITPLVFEMKRLGLFTPCWSCEGHLRPDRSLWKMPSVWFYCDSMVHVRLLSQGLSNLRTARALSAPWHVAVTFSDADNPETTFALEPSRAGDEKLSLPALQKDAGVIARALNKMMNEEGRTLQREAGKVLERSS